MCTVLKIPAQDLQLFDVIYDGSDEDGGERAIVTSLEVNTLTVSIGLDNGSTIAATHNAGFELAYRPKD